MIVGHIGGIQTGYQLQRSLRLRASASAHLTRTLTTSSAPQRATWSFWVKQGSSTNHLFAWVARSGSTSNDVFQLVLNSSGMEIFVRDGGLVVHANGTVPMTLRDPSAWYHVVITIDTTQAVNFDRIRVYVNGQQRPNSSASVFSQNVALQNLFTNAHYLHTNFGNGTFSDCYFADFHCVDGQALTPSAFGQFDANGMWQAKPYAGTYGTNGFRLDFSDPTSTTTLMLDRSGNGNNWTANNISTTAGATYDSMLDVPLGGGGGERGNYATLNPVDALNNNSNFSITNGNLRAAHNGANTGGSNFATLIPDTGKWYVEATIVTTGRLAIGVTSHLQQWGSLNRQPLEHPNSVLWAGGNAGFNYFQNGSNIGGTDTWANNDVVMLAYDCTNGRVWFGKNGTWNGSGNPATGTGQQGTTTAGSLGVIWGNISSGLAMEAVFNFGQRPFTYTPPTGFKALHTGNLPAPAITNPKLHFDVVTRLGTGSTYSLTGLQFQPDLLWSKNRVNTANHGIVDSVRGVGAKFLHSENTAVEDGFGANLTSFNADGYTAAVGSSNFSYLNTVSETYVNWLWKAGGAPVTNNAGSISAQVSANPVAGFSIVTYTGTGANATVGHGLGVAPKMVIVKARNLASQNWHVYHAAVDAAPATYVLGLNLTVARSPSSTAWNNTAPTSSVFSLGTDTSGNNNTTNYVAYCFAEIPGFSKFGSYTGNGSADGPFVHCGFRPRYVMVKRTDTTSDWTIFDTARDTANVAVNRLFPNSAIAESTGVNFDILGNGFKLRDSGAGVNASGGTYIFIAFAEAPFQSALAR